MSNTQIQIIGVPADIQAWVEASVSTAFEKLSINSTEKLTAINNKPVTAPELCQYLNISPPTLIRWRKKGKIPFLKIGGSIRYDKVAVIAAIENKKGGKL